MGVLRAAAIIAASGMMTANAWGTQPSAEVVAGFRNIPVAELQRLISARVQCTDYDGLADDLLTAGLGKSGLAGGAPGFADPANPTAAELRRLAIYSNYRALVDITAGGGYGSLYGPNVRADGTVTTDEGLVPGKECLTFADDGHGRKNVTLMVQVPQSFDPDHPCIVTAPSSGSRGIYGAIATSGEWGLKNACAVAYTDKGTGTGAHDLQNDTVSLIDGLRESADFAGKRSNFTALISDAERDAFNSQTPNRFAFKHAHSQQNPEDDWGVNVLQSVLFAFIQLNRQYPDALIFPANTIVIGSSVSNGGGASVRAAEIDIFGLIDGLAVSEPNVNPPRGSRFAIVQGSQKPFFGGGKPLFDYTTLLNVFQGCANLAQSDAPLNTLPASLNENRCSSLRAKGLLTTTTVADQAVEAQSIINRYGFLSEQNIVEPSHWTIFVPQGIAVTYANAYARAQVQDNLCDFSFAATDATGSPTALATAATAQLFSSANGIPQTAGINVVNNASPGGPLQNTASASSSNGAFDQNLDGALCLRALWTGRDAVTGTPLTGALLKAHRKLRHGVANILASANLHHLPAIFVTGRSDAILPPNHTSRAYFVRNRQIERGASRLRYIEVTNAQHLDALNPVGGFDIRFVPLHHYFIQALDMMYAHLKSRVPLPKSQVVQTIPRGGVPGSAPAIETSTNLPPIEMIPSPDQQIRFYGDVLRIPN
jgi:hydroxybutyrate-dimer hydrolase